MKIAEHLQIFRRALGMMFRTEKAFCVSLIARNMLEGFSPYLPVYFTACLVDGVADGAPGRTLLFYAAMTVGLTFFLELIKLIFANTQEESIAAWYRAENWNYSEKAMQMSYASIEDHDVALLRSRIQAESQTGFNRFYLHMGVRDLSMYSCQIVASVAMLFPFFLGGTTAPVWKLLFAFAAVCSAVCSFLTNRKNAALQMERSEKNVNLNQYMDRSSDYIGDYKNGQDIRLYGMEEFLAALRRSYDEAYTNYVNGDKYKKLFLDMVNQICSYLMRYVVYLILIMAAVAGRISVGSIARYVSSLMLLMNAVLGISGAVQKLAVNNVYLKRYFSYFDIPNTMYQGTLTVEKRDDNEYDIEFRNVSFHYPGTKEYALRHVNCKCKVGEKMAIVGPNGSGKTTFIKLLCRLYDPSEGEILLNGVDIRKYDYEEYLGIFSVVFQDFKLFDYTLGENVAASATYEEGKVRVSLEMAGFGDRLRSMRDGLSTWLNQGYSADGVEISGGEAQKIALARALYKDAPFIVLDEPTAALDPESEYEVYSSFHQITGDKTVLYISHRLASCRFCDRILVFDKGQIIQEGGHGELLADSAGMYGKLWDAQAQYYDTRIARVRST